MPDRTVEFVLEKVTKATYRFRQVEGDEVGTIYLKQTLFKDKPEKISVTIHLPDEQ